MQKSGLLIVALLAWSSLLGGCSLIFRDHTPARVVDLPVKGNLQEIDIAVIDERPGVVDGSRTSAQLGIRSGLLGREQTVETVNGQPLADVFEATLTAALERRNFKVQQTGGRTVQLIIREWSVDAVSDFRLDYSLQLSILAVDGQLLASNADKGHAFLTETEMEKTVDATLADVLDQRLKQMFADEAIGAALDY